MKKYAVVLLLCAVGSPSAHAASRILVLNIGSFTCSTTNFAGITEGLALQSWSWGASTPIAGANGGTVRLGKPSLDLLVVNKATDKCSSELLGLNLKGQNSSTVTVTEYDLDPTDGKFVAAIVVKLTDALLAGYDISGSTTSAPAEILSFSFQKICVTNDSITATVCYSSSETSAANAGSSAFRGVGGF
jgi:type VI protein secretion system component Hcp